MRKGNLFVISGPSGVGKGTLMALLSGMVPDLWVSVSATTRDPRPGERENIDYLYITRDEFMQRVDAGDMLEWAEYSGHLYGSPRGRIEQHMRDGYQVILEIEVQGALQVRDTDPDVHLVFIEPPSMEELERRLRARATDSEESIMQRLETARIELSRKMEYDYRLVNDDAERAARELADYINAYAEDRAR